MTQCGDIDLFCPLGPNIVPGLELDASTYMLQKWVPDIKTEVPRSPVIAPGHTAHGDHSLACLPAPLFGAVPTGHTGLPAGGGRGRSTQVSSLLAALCQETSIQLLASLVVFHEFTLFPPAVTKKETDFLSSRDLVGGAVAARSNAVHELSLGRQHVLG